jgi:hypothetical protein
MERIRGASEACDFVRQINISPAAAAFDEAMKSE